MKPTIRTSVMLEIPFHDIDSWNMVWHGHYLKYLEIARTELMRGLGLDVPDMSAMGCTWPIVECQIKYIRPLVYGQKIRVDTWLEEYESRLKIRYEIRDADTDQRLSKATTVQLAVETGTGELRFENPRPLIEAIEGALERVQA